MFEVRHGHGGLLGSRCQGAGQMLKNENLMHFGEWAVISTDVLV